MNHLRVSAIFEPGHLEVHRHEADADQPAWAVLAFDSHTGPALGLHLHGLDAVADLEAALAEVREYLSNDSAARNAA